MVPRAAPLRVVVRVAGWDAPGEAGWYVGHLPTGGRTVYANEFEGAPQPEPAR